MCLICVRILRIFFKKVLFVILVLDNFTSIAVSPVLINCHLPLNYRELFRFYFTRSSRSLLAAKLLTWLLILRNSYTAAEFVFNWKMTTAPPSTPIFQHEIAFCSIWVRKFRSWNRGKTKRLKNVNPSKRSQVPALTRKAKAKDGREGSTDRISMEITIQQDTETESGWELLVFGFVLRAVITRASFVHFNFYCNKTVQ